MLQTNFKVGWVFSEFGFLWVIALFLKWKCEAKFNPDGRQVATIIPAHEIHTGWLSIRYRLSVVANQGRQPVCTRPYSKMKWSEFPHWQLPWIRCTDQCSKSRVTTSVASSITQCTGHKSATRNTTPTSQQLTLCHGPPKNAYTWKLASPI